MSRNYGIIYGLIDSNKSVRYIGQTIQPIIKRYKQHLWCSIKYKNHLGSMKGCELSKHHRHSEETKRKIGLTTIKTHTGLKRSKETKDKIANSRLKYKGDKHPLFGKPVSQESINKRILKLNKSVLQFSKEGKFIKEFISISFAAKEINVNFTNISACCLGKQKTAYGYIWKFKNLKN